MKASRLAGYKAIVLRNIPKAMVELLVRHVPGPLVDQPAKHGERTVYTIPKLALILMRVEQPLPAI